MPDRWSVAIRSGGISPGDRAFLLRQHRDRGVVASGYFVSGVEPGPHWDGSGRSSTFAQVEWDAVVDLDDPLPVEVLTHQITHVHWDRMQGSGVEIPPAYAEALEELWAADIGTVVGRSPDRSVGATTWVWSSANAIRERR